MSFDTARLKDFCGQLPGATTRLHGPPSNVLAYVVGDKQFAYFKTSEPEAWRFSIRVSAERFLELTDMPGIKPARYMGRFHWITIVRVQAMPPDYLKELVEASYQRALDALSKAARKAALTPVDQAPSGAPGR